MKAKAIVKGNEKVKKSLLHLFTVAICLGGGLGLNSSCSSKFNCSSGFHEENGNCKPNVVDCDKDNEIEHGKGEKAWDSNRSQYGDCKPKECDAGYYSPDKKVCKEAEEGFYSPAKMLIKLRCKTKSIAAIFTAKGQASNDCLWECQDGYTINNSGKGCKMICLSGWTEIPGGCAPPTNGG